MTTLLPTHTPVLFAEAVERAAELLRQGQVVALPTETVYGLAANAFDPDAVRRIYEAKARPARNPVIVHVDGTQLARRCAAAWPDPADALARAFWPGPLTLVVAKASVVPDIVTAGGPTVGLRWPSHPFIQAVIRTCGFPLAAPSANPSTRTSPTTALHVLNTLQGRIPLVVDGGPCQVGIESTVVDLTTTPGRVLRPGMIHLESLQAAWPGITTVTLPPTDQPLRSPGTLDRHYAPAARLRVLHWSDDADLRRQIASIPRTAAARTCVLAHSRIPAAAEFLRVSVIPHDPHAFARALYAELHRCDELGATTIVVEALPSHAEWQALTDRLNRAASP